MVLAVPVPVSGEPRGEEARRAAGPNRAEKPLPAADPSLDRLIAKSVIMASIFAVDVAVDVGDVGDCLLCVVLSS
jgi:hypothetical protein